MGFIRKEDSYRMTARKDLMLNTKKTPLHHCKGVSMIQFPIITSPTPNPTLYPRLS
ncbi:MAG: hypothetical protein ACOYMA_05750 [Bacteroidia bacterium]